MYRYIKAIAKSEKFPAHKGFFELKIVWVTIATVMSISLSIAITISLNSNLMWDWSFIGWNNFISYFQVPLGIMALLIPLGAIYATNHRSKQTLEQIRLTSEQNNFSNYYKHIEEFEKYCDTHKSIALKEASRRKLHRIMFPDARDGYFFVNNELTKELESRVVKMATKLKETDWESKVFTNILLEDTSRFMNLCEIEGLKLLSSKKTVFFQYMRNFNSISKMRDSDTALKNANLLFSSFWVMRRILEVYDSVAEFDTKHQKSLVLDMLTFRMDALFDLIGFVEPSKIERYPIFCFHDDAPETRPDDADLNDIFVTNVSIAEFKEAQKILLRSIATFKSEYC
ncbi:hypothetical protein ACEI31_000006 [Vibrio parahaemolyticus]